MLKDMQMTSYVAAFKAKGVDGKKLCSMKADDLAALDVTNAAHVKALMQKVELYRDMVKAGATDDGLSVAQATDLAALRKKWDACTSAMATSLAACTTPMATSMAACTTPMATSLAACTTPMMESLSSCTDAMRSALPGGGGGPPPAAVAARGRGRRSQVIAPMAKVPDGWKPPVHKKRPDEEAFLKQSLSVNRLFKNLTSSDCEVIVKAFEKVAFKKGDKVITQGDRKAETFFLLHSGTCDISVEGKGTVLKATKGVAFGELALLHNAPRAATVTAEEAVVAWRVDATTFKAILMGKAKQDAKDYSGFIGEVPLLRSLKEGERRALLDALSEVNFSAGAVVIKEGDQGDAFFLIRDGEVKCTKRSAKEEVSKRLTKGDFFGELALISASDGRRAVTVTTTAPTTLLRLDRDAFERLLGPSALSAKAIEKAAAGQGRK